MGQRILVFESDSGFVQKLQAGFGKFGAKVDIVDSADAGLERAKSEQPDLVLMSVDAMPAPGEAFLVCKKFKSDDTLKGVPFVIMGGMQHMSAFESHKKLKKRRADEYLQLPIDFDDLIHRVQPLVSFEAEGSVDDEIDVFADNAFDDLILEEEGGLNASTVTPSAVRTPAPPPPSEKPKPPAAAAKKREVSKTRPASPPSFMEGGVPAAPVSDPKKREAPAKTEQEPSPPVAVATMADEEDSETEVLRVQVQRLRRDLEAAKKASGGGGVSSRDYLDLRETLNTKEKELLELKDQIARRDKALLQANEKSLQFERRLADQDDALAEVERQFSDASEQLQQRRKEIESFAKRLDEARGQLARSESKLGVLEEEYDGAKVAHAKQLEELEEESVAARARRNAEHAAAFESLKDSHGNEMTAARENFSSNVARLKEEHAKAMASQQKTAEDELAKQLEATTAELRDEAQKQRDDLENGHGRELAVLGRKLSEADARIATVEEDLAAQQATTQEREQELGSVRAELASRNEDLESTRANLSEARSENEVLEKTNLEQSKASGDLRRRLSDTEGKLSRAVAKIQADEELLQRVRKAMGIGLGLLEEQKTTPYQE